jgi:hypothetical protein
MGDRIELWDGLTGRQQQECRQALRQLLVAVARHSLTAIGDRRGSLGQGSENSTHA